MGQTFTPTLEPDVLDRLWEYVLPFRKLFPRSDQFRQGRIYVHGLLLDGERKSIEPLSQRVPDGNDQRLQQFINQSPWDPQPVLKAYRARMAEAFASPDGVLILDDTGFPKQGKHSVGVARQYSGCLGKTGNCQVAVSYHYASATGEYPLHLRLYLPEAWTADPDRLDRAHVPQDERPFQTKGQIALDLLDALREEELPFAVLVADAGYGVSGPFRQALEERGVPYLVGIGGDELVWTAPPEWEPPAPSTGPGRRATRAHLAATAPRPVGVRTLAATLERTPVTWRDGTKTRLQADFAWVRVWVAHQWQQGIPVEAIPDAEASARWLLVEWRSDGTVKYALSNLPAATSLEQAVGWWKTRWQVERGYQQLKDELGLDHFEGRSWPGFHHHVTMTFLAYGFLALERRHTEVHAAPEEETPPSSGRTRRVASPSRGCDAPSR